MAQIRLLLFIFFTFVILIPGTLGQLSCRDNAGNAVDWFVIYKIPSKAQQLTGTTVPNNGYVFAYITSSSNPNPGWIFNKEDLTTTEHLLHKTLSQQKETTNIQYLAYNDQEAESLETDSEDWSNSTTLANSIYAHAKGFIWYNKTDNTGIFVTHSVPGYEPIPTEKESWRYPSSGILNGQLFFCISFNDTTNKTKILNHIANMNVKIVKEKNTIPAEEYNDSMIGLPFKNITQIIKTTAGRDITLYSKAAPREEKTAFKDIYHYYKKTANMRVLSWGPNVENIPNIEDKEKDVKCYREKGNQLTAMDVQQVLMNFDTVSFLWGTCTSNVSGGIARQDHSKWMIIKNGNNKSHTFCAGDMNRHETQTRRSGGLVCIDNTGLGDAFEKIINI